MDQNVYLKLFCKTSTIAFSSIPAFYKAEDSPNLKPGSYCLQRISLVLNVTIGPIWNGCQKLF